MLLVPVRTVPINEHTHRLPLWTDWHWAEARKGDSTRYTQDVFVYWYGPVQSKRTVRAVPVPLCGLTVG
jgi:hypothetical protein